MRDFSGLVRFAGRGSSVLRTVGQSLLFGPPACLGEAFLAMGAADETAGLGQAGGHLAGLQHGLPHAFQPGGTS